MGKFCLQTTFLMLRLEKNVFLFVNFLKRCFVRRVNFGRFWRWRKMFFRIVFLDIPEQLCYYIIYIWENSAQNCPFGGVLFDLLARMHLVEPFSTRARPPAKPDRKGVLRHPNGANENNPRAKKVVNSCRRKRA